MMPWSTQAYLSSLRSCANSEKKKSNRPFSLRDTVLLGP